jgi:hypothetical protein
MLIILPVLGGTHVMFMISEKARLKAMLCKIGLNSTVFPLVL